MKKTKNYECGSISNNSKLLITRVTNQYEGKSERYNLLGRPVHRNYNILFGNLHWRSVKLLSI